ncbi:hypothetical protein [Jeongeupia naejangsanensis]|uniref:GspL cytoplasmic actin-ATPase-like domain-containing protein n=1 Tax=Jeongeupia naejangsanensis TaxID=613195 RepID=A0ABS2BLU1_9NEIS|nr:hypothetical protein [Jeongeupia naejangsanensis]MBM3115956.1 hypothetical protein [Jeongeupia naejangsanensis]
MRWWHLPASGRDGLVVLAQQRIIVGPLGASWRAEVQFDTGPQGLADLALYCQHNPYRRFHLLVLGSDEEFRFDTLPPVRGRDRQSLITRRLEQAWRGSPYRRALALDDGMLVLSALTQREPIDALVQSLLNAGCPIAGLYTLPVLAAALLPRAVSQTGPTVLLAPVPGGGTQQVWLMPDGLRFARSSQARADVACADVLADEVRLTQHYLANERILPRDARVTLLLLDGEAGVAVRLQQRLAAAGEAVQVNTLAQTDLSRTLGLPAGDDMLALWAAAIVRHGRSARYADPALRRFETLRRARQYLGWSGAAVLSVAAVSALTVWLETRELEARAAVQQARLRTLQHESQRVSAELVRHGVGDPLALRAVNRLYRNGMASWPSAEAHAREISRTLQAFPDLRVDLLSWDVALPVATASPEEGEAPVPIGTWTQRMALSGHVLPPVDARQALARVEALVTRLRAEHGLRVEVTRLPLDVRSQATIQNPLEATDDATGALGFALTLELPAGAAS